MDLRGNYAYIGYYRYGEKLYTNDISDPENLEMNVGYRTIPLLQDFVTDGTYLYGAFGEYGIIVLI
jgi:hypothetical protein